MGDSRAIRSKRFHRIHAEVAVSTVEARHSRRGKILPPPELAFNLSSGTVILLFRSLNEVCNIVIAHSRGWNFNPECSTNQPKFVGVRHECRIRSAGARETLSWLLLGWRWH